MEMSTEKRDYSAWQNIGAGYLTSSKKMVKLSLHLPQIPESERPVKVYFWLTDMEALMSERKESMPVKLYRGEPEK